MKQTMPWRAIALASCLSLSAATMPLTANAQQALWPVKPIRLVVGGPAGGNADSLARLPGLTAQRFGNRPQEINIRGFAGDFSFSHCSSPIWKNAWFFCRRISPARARARSVFSRCWAMVPRW